MNKGEKGDGKRKRGMRKWRGRVKKSKGTCWPGQAKPFATS